MFKDGETILDVLQRRNQWEEEVPRYIPPLDYNDPGYIPDHTGGNRVFICKRNKAFILKFELVSFR